MIGPGPSEPWDEGLADAVSLVEVLRRDDRHTAGDLAFILRRANVYDVAVTLAKLLSVACDEQYVRPAHLREWSREAVRRP